MDNPLDELLGESTFRDVVYWQLGDDLAREIKEAKVELRVYFKERSYEFINCPPDLMEKIRAVKENVTHLTLRDS